MRTLMQKRAAASPPSDVGGSGLASLMDGRRVQFLPVMWRATLDDFEPPPPDNEDDAAAEHLDNVFSLDEILGGKESIPFVKQLISSVALDVPFYLSRHKNEILSRVRLQTNHIWRVFVQVSSARSCHTRSEADSLDTAQPRFPRQGRQDESHRAQLGRRHCRRRTFRAANTRHATERAQHV